MLDEDAQATAYNLAVESIALQAAQEALQQGPEAEAQAVAALAAEVKSAPAMEYGKAEAGEDVRQQGVDAANLAQASAQPIALIEIDPAIPGGWGPVKSKPFRMASTLTWKPRPSQWSAGKLRQPAKSRLVVKWKSGAKTDLGKVKIKSKQGSGKPVPTLRSANLVKSGKSSPSLIASR